MKAAVLLAAFLTLGSLGVQYAQNPHVTRWATPDGRETMQIAQGHSSGYTMPDRVRRLLPITLFWGLSLGHGSAMPYAAVVVAFFGNLLLAWAVARMVPRPWTAGLIVLLPPLFVASRALETTTLGLGLALVGWQSRNRVLLLLAGLEHETLLAFSWVARRVSPILIWLCWAAIAAAFWSPRNNGNLAFFGAFRSHIQDDHVMHFLMFALTYVFAVFALRVHRELTLIYLGYSLVMGTASGLYWTDFTRLLAPLWVLGFIELVRQIESARTPPIRESGGVRAMGIAD